MTFSLKCKGEMSRYPIVDKKIVIAELSALIRTIGSISFRGLNEFVIDLSTENSAISRRVFKIIKFLYNFNCNVIVKKSNRFKKHNRYSLVIDREYAVKILIDTRIIESEHVNILEFNYGVPQYIYTDASYIKAYLRGAFLGSGSINDPSKSYHLELVTDKLAHAEGIEKLMNNFELGAKTIERKQNFVTYLKESDKIVDYLNITGAHKNLLEIENIRVIKDVRNRVNRETNCDTANLNKIVDAAIRQKLCILKLQNAGILTSLPDNLRELAQLRLDNEDASLRELGEMLEPPLGKSGVNHRLKKIEKIAEEI